MAADGSRQQAIVAEVIESLGSEVPLSASPYEGQIPWCPVREELVFQRGQYVFGNPVAAIPRRGDDIIRADHGDCVCGRHDLADGHGAAFDATRLPRSGQKEERRKLQPRMEPKAHSRFALARNSLSP